MGSVRHAVHYVARKGLSEEVAGDLDLKGWKESASGSTREQHSRRRAKCGNPEKDSEHECK